MDWKVNDLAWSINPFTGKTEGMVKIVALSHPRLELGYDCVCEEFGNPSPNTHYWSYKFEWLRPFDGDTEKLKEEQKEIET